MAEKRRFLDVWLVESNTVYKEVPFNVVCDWVQQGRLLEDDMIKPSGTKDWFKIGKSPDLTPYLPRAEPYRPADQAEALEPVGLDFSYKRPHEDEDQDVDMIPLIDVSLVLLIFFMLASTGAVASTMINNPSAENDLLANDPDSMRVDVTLENGNPVYAVGVGTRAPDEDDRDLHTKDAVLDRLKAKLESTRKPQIELVINADKTVPAKVARDLLLALRAKPFRDRISLNFYGVSEKRE
jgi:biopolymer transport protein ExbD